MSRVLATLAVFALGILLSLYLSWSLSRPLQRPHRRRAAGGGGRPLGAGPAGGQATRSASLARTLQRDGGAAARASRASRSGCTSRSARARIGRLASAVAHEIRNPLNFINLSIDHVRERLGPEEPTRREDFDRILGNMKAEISRLNRLVGRLPVLRQAHAPRTRGSCAVEDVLREVAALVDHKARDQGIALEVDAPDGPAPRSWPTPSS